VHIHTEIRSRICKTENEKRERREGGRGKNESGWFIESLSPARWICAEEGAGGGAFI